jgi:hypothetical protein
MWYTWFQKCQVIYEKATTMQVVADTFQQEHWAEHQNTE